MNETFYASQRASRRPAFVPAPPALERTTPLDDDLSGAGLAVLTPDGRRLPIAKELLIGSDEAAAIRLRDPFASRHHCRLLLEGNEALVRDLGSTNGTVVNGVRVARAVLRPGLIITVGMTRLQIVRQERCDATLVGEAPLMQQLRASIERVAALPLPVLILGETGTGKELVARALHEGSGRAGHFIPVNCGSLPKELIESELFGHERGAFTGAEARRRGLFQEADRGTLFLDEIGELPLALQTRLLRVLENGCVRPVGATRETPVEARIVAATHVDLAAAVAEGRLRADLYYRLNVATLETPPLRARKEDIPLLAARVLADEAAQGRRCRLSPGAMAALLDHDWPGNVRELLNVLRRATAFGEPIIEPAALRLGVSPRPPRPPEGRDLLPVAGQTLEQIERAVIARSLREHRGNQRATSSALAIPRSTLNDKLRRYGIDPKGV